MTKIAGATNLKVGKFETDFMGPHKPPLFRPITRIRALSFEGRIFEGSCSRDFWIDGDYDRHDMGEILWKFGTEFKRRFQPKIKKSRATNLPDDLSLIIPRVSTPVGMLYVQETQREGYQTKNFIFPPENADPRYLNYLSLTGIAIAIKGAEHFIHPVENHGEGIDLSSLFGILQLALGDNTHGFINNRFLTHGFPGVAELLISCLTAVNTAVPKRLPEEAALSAIAQVINLFERGARELHGSAG
ncbi:MAG: hypothetical protein ABIE74_02720 [Pseudomonadota bacterium]